MSAVIASLVVATAVANTSLAEPPKRLPRVAPPDYRAVVYLMQPTGFNQSLFFVDDVKVATLTWRDCTVMTLPPGNHVIRHEFASIPLLTFPPQPLKMATDLHAGQSYYFAVNDGGPGPPQSGPPQYGVQYYTWTLSAPNEQEAEQALQRCHPIGPINLEKVEGWSPVPYEPRKPKPRAGPP